MAEVVMNDRREGEPYYGEGGAAQPDVSEAKARAEADKRAHESREGPEGEGGPTGTR